MKRAGMIAVGTAMVAALSWAATNEVVSVNIVGYSKIALPPGGAFIQSSLPFDAFDATLLGAFGTNQLLKNAKAGGADNVYLWDATAQAYARYYMKPDGLFYLFGGSASNPPLRPGQGFWVGSGTTASLTNEICLMGEVVDVVTQQTRVVQGFQMLGYPFSCDIHVQDTAFATNGATANAKAGGADNIYVWDGTTYKRYYLKPDGKWYVFGGSIATNVTDSLSMGKGFWYEARGTFNWSETNKYSAIFQ